MCGIAGVVSRGDRPVEPAAVKRMTDVLAHRGPDDAGIAFFEPGRGANGGWCCSFTDPAFAHDNEHLPVYGGAYCQDELRRGRFAVGLGHRRLAILDLTHHGHQPMAGADQRHWIVFNGEIYNFRELRAELETRGRRFRTRTDTEVILQLWEEHGPAALSMLDGMFALAIYDRLEHTVTLARDRFGVKPLYYAATQDFVVFGSEIKSLFAGGLVEASIEPAGLVEYLTFQNTFGDGTIWSNVQLLEPGCVLTVRPGLIGKVRPQRFHDGFPPFDTSSSNDFNAADAVALTFSDAVERQLVSDAPVGAYLSGGMDSGSIVAAAARRIPRLLTFTGGFDLTNVNGLEQGFDERPLAERLSYLLQTEHYAVVLHAGDMPAAMERLTWHMDDPRVGMCHQNWYVAKLASRFVKVCLAGTGGDELFAGYPWRYRHATTADDTEAFDDAYFADWHRLLPRDEVGRLFVPEVRSLTEGVRAAFDTVMDNAPAWQSDAPAWENLLQRALHFEFRTFLHGLLITEDRISMAHGLEARVPFLDNALADLAFHVRPAMKTRRVATRQGKRVLRKAMRANLPQEFLDQKKQGFSPPDENWYRGPSMDYIKMILFDRRTLERPWFDHGFVRSMLDEHFSGRRNHRLLIWSLLSVEWIQRHFAGSATPVERQPASSPVVAGSIAADP
jgi:asparagine synthase (glutamine-hydrolysing)